MKTLSLNLIKIAIMAILVLTVYNTVVDKIETFKNNGVVQQVQDNKTELSSLIAQIK